MYLFQAAQHTSTEWSAGHKSVARVYK